MLFCRERGRFFLFALAGAMVLAGLCQQAWAATGFTVVNAPNAVLNYQSGTAITAIDAAGDTAGIYGGADRSAHGFLRTAAGVFTVLDSVYAKQKTVAPIGFDGSGNLFGIYLDENSALHGFYRKTSGTVQTLTCADAGTDADQGTAPMQIDSVGNISGIYFDANNLTHAFYSKAASGVCTEIPDASLTTASNFNGAFNVSVASASGSIYLAGTYLDANSVAHGFIRNPAGTFTTVNITGASTSANGGTAIEAVDAAGNAGGAYVDSNMAVHSFLRTAAGTTVPCTVSGAGTGTLQGVIPFTFPMHFDTAGDLFGFYLDSTNSARAFKCTKAGVVTTFAAPGAASTLAAQARIKALIHGLGGVKSNTGKHSVAGRTLTMVHALSLISGKSLVSSSNKISVQSKAAPMADFSGGIFDGTNTYLGTIPFAVNAGGKLVGSYIDGELVLHGFSRTSSGGINTFDAPAAGTALAMGTLGFAINDSGTIAGTYIDSNLAFHGYILNQGGTATTASLSASATSITYGQPVTLTATIASAPANGEKVWFLAGGSQIGSASLSGGVASLKVAALPAGTQSITAVYGGNATYAGSTSAAVSVVVAKDVSTTTLTSSATTSAYGSNVVLKATIGTTYGKTPTGTVKFLSGTTTLSSVSLVGGVASLSLSTLPVGTDSITAVYAGDSNYKTSTSAAVSVTVTKGTPTIKWATPASIHYGTALSATQLNAVATVPGTFAYTPAAGTIPAKGTVTLAANFTPSDTTLWNLATASTSLTVTDALTLTTPTMKLTPSATSIAASNVLAVTAQLTGASTAPTGSVSLTYGSFTTPPFFLVSGKAVIEVPAGVLTVGTDTLTVKYLPDTTSAALYTAVSGTTSVTVTAAATSTTSTTLAMTSGTSVVTTLTEGALLKLIATVKDSTSALITKGTVRFCDASAAFCTDVHQLGTAQLSSTGTAQLLLTPAAGTHQYRAIFAGYGTVASSQSAISSIKVSASTHASETLIGASADSTSSTGAAVSYTLSGSVAGTSGLAPAGSLSFIDTNNGNAVVGTGTLAAAAANVTLAQSQSIPLDENSYNTLTATGDFNKDGYTDFVAYDSEAGELRTYLGSASGQFTLSSTLSLGNVNSYATRMVASDLDGDGNLDLAVVSPNNSSTGTSPLLYTFWGAGDGSFTAGTTYEIAGHQPTGLVAGDFNRDGLMDLAVYNMYDAANSGNGVITLLKGQGSRSFKIASTTISTTGNGQNMIGGDLNNDGYPDLLISDYSGNLYAVLGSASGTTIKTSSLNMYSGVYALADFNGDGILDVSVANNNNQTIAVFKGNGDGTFGTTSLNTMSIGFSIQQLQVADLNRDGKSDLLATGNMNLAILAGSGNVRFTTLVNRAVISSGYVDGWKLVSQNGSGAVRLLCKIEASSSSTSATSPLTHSSSDLSFGIFSPLMSASKASVTGITVKGAGPHMVAARFAGDSNNAASTSIATAYLYAPAPAPSIVLPSGTYIGTQSVAITSSLAGASIYYTTDGSTPTTDSTKYMAPIAVYSASTIKAIAVSSAYSPSPVASATYTIVASVSTGAPAWKWLSGSATTSTVSDSSSAPGSRDSSLAWTDASGNLWLYGGQGSDSTGSWGPLADLWMYSPSTAKWTLKSSTTSLTGIIAPSYGTKGTAASTNTPGGRFAANTWVDSTGRLWLFGGRSSGNFMNDLWFYQPTTGLWTWVGGANSGGDYGVYGTKGTAATTNLPPARANSINWIDKSGNLWLFGGVSMSGNLNDLWVYNPTKATWAWVSGSSTAGAAGVYGTKGTAAATNLPGARFSAVSFTDASGNLWLFGGVGSGWRTFNDLWKFVPNSTATGGTWTWMSGSSSVDQRGNYGSYRVSAATNVPGGRSDMVSWTDASGNFWLYGGAGYGIKLSGTLSDLWEYIPSTGQWTWQGGSSETEQASVHGTLGVFSTSNSPGGRYDSSSWRGSNGALYLFGGYAMVDATSSQSGDSNDANDLMVYQMEGVVVPPIFTPSSGTITSGSTVALSTTTLNASIYYTTDGTTPTTASKLYSTPIAITSSITIKAFAVKSGAINSPVSSATYLVK